MCVCGEQKKNGRKKQKAKEERITDDEQMKQRRTSHLLEYNRLYSVRTAGHKKSPRMENEERKKISQ